MAITKANLDQYKANLTPGVIALFNAYPNSFRLPVYPTRRSGSAPQWVYENTAKNAVNANTVNVIMGMVVSALFGAAAISHTRRNGNGDD